MTIINANELNAITRKDIVDLFCDKLMKEISDTNKKGKRSTVFWTSCIDLDNGTTVRFDDYSNDIKKVFTSHGYTIKPTGYIGGVWQLTEDIIW